MGDAGHASKQCSTESEGQRPLARAKRERANTRDHSNSKRRPKEARMSKERAHNELRAAAGQGPAPGLGRWAGVVTGHRSPTSPGTSVDCELAQGRACGRTTLTRTGVGTHEGPVPSRSRSAVQELACGHAHDGVHPTYARASPSPGGPQHDVNQGDVAARGHRGAAGQRPALRG